jgi:hypothetical protein
MSVESLLSLYFRVAFLKRGTCWCCHCIRSTSRTCVHRWRVAQTAKVEAGNLQAGLKRLRFLCCDCGQHKLNKMCLEYSMQRATTVQWTSCSASSSKVIFSRGVSAPLRGRI